ncbi:MAG: hypothetical protein AAFR90_10060 [Pseudomonadota bacterium]
MEAVRLYQAAYGLAEALLAVSEISVILIVAAIGWGATMRSNNLPIPITYKILTSVALTGFIGFGWYAAELAADRVNATLEASKYLFETQLDAIPKDVVERMTRPVSMQYDRYVVPAMLLISLGLIWANKSKK